MTNSSKAASIPFSDFLQENDFIEIARKARAQKIKEQEEARIEAAKPKISEEDVQAAERRGFEQGVEQGKQEALTLLKAEMEENIATMRAKFDDLEPLKIELAAKMESDMLVLVRHIMNHIAGKLQDQFNQDLLQAALKTAVMSVQDGLKLNLQIHPESKSYLQETCGELLSSWDVSWKENTKLAVGHCIMEWENQGIELNFEHTSKEIDTLLNGAITGAQHAYEEIHKEQQSFVEPAQAAPQAEPTEIEGTEAMEPENAPVEENLAQNPTPPETPAETEGEVNGEKEMPQEETETI